MSELIGTILELKGVIAYLVIAALAYAETAALAGLILPGEASLMLGGLLAARGNLSLPVVAAVCILAAAAGDATGYWVGRKWFRALLKIRWFNKIVGPRLDKAKDFLDRHGPPALFLARWASVVRTLTPPLAGMSENPFPRFMLGAAAGAVTWATAFVLLGYFAGASFDSIQQLAGRASLVLVIVVVVIVVARWVTRAIIRHKEGVVALWRRLMDSRLVRWLVGRYGSELRWLGRRVDPHLDRGLRLTTALVALGTATWLAGALIEDVVAREEAALWDRPVMQWVSEHRTAEAVLVADVVAAPFEFPGVIATLVVITGCLFLWRGWRGAVRAPVSLIGAFGLCALLQVLLAGRSDASEFPATATSTAAAATVGVSSVLASQTRWVVGARAAGAGAALTVIVGIAVLVTAESVLTGVIAGAAVGALWSAAVEVARVGAPRQNLSDAGSKASRRRSSQTDRRSPGNEARRRRRTTQRSGR